MLEGGALLACQIDGEALMLERRGPLRLVIPGDYGIECSEVARSTGTRGPRCLGTGHDCLPQRSRACDGARQRERYPPDMGT